MIFKASSTGGYFCGHLLYLAFKSQDVSNFGPN